MARAAVLMAILTRVAAADPVRLEVTSDRCDLAPVRAAVAQLAGGDPFGDAGDGAIRVDGTQLDDTPIARIWFVDAGGPIRGPRVVTAASCAELIDSVAVVVAMALPHDPPPPRQLPDPEDQAPAESETIAPAPAPRGATELLLGGAVTARGSHEELLAGVRWKRAAFSAALTLRHEPDDAITLSHMSAVDVGRTDMSVSPCLHAGEFGGCVVAGFGVIHGAGAGLVRARSVVSPVAFTGLALTWERALGSRLAVRTHLEADALLTSTELDVDDMPVWTSSRIEADAGLALLVRFP